MSFTGVPSSPASADQSAEVALELERILASSQFQSSMQCQRFLRYVVEQTLRGHADAIKEQIIGIEVFGKPPSYSPSEDACVRVKASEVRKRLRYYYSGLQEKPAVSIDLPVGTYVPRFHRQEPGTPQEPSRTQPSAQSPGPAPGPVPSRPRRWPWIAAMLVLGIVAGMNVYRLKSHPPVARSLAQFWGPVYKSGQAALLCAAPVPVFTLLRDPTPDRPTKVSDFVTISDRFVSVDDLNAVSQISEMFKAKRWPYKLRIGNIESFREFRSTPVVLVGFSYTRWDALNHGSRYSIDLDKRPFGVLDHGKMTAWTIPTNPDDPQLNEDYAIVSRIFDQDTGNILIEIAGISHYGTEAATDFVTNPDELASVLARLPQGWQKKNLQLVLHTSVIADAPTAPQVLASYVW